MERWVELSKGLQPKNNVCNADGSKPVSYLFPNNAYEWVAKNIATEELTIIEKWYIETGWTADPAGFTSICLVDNSVMNVLAAENPEAFMHIVTTSHIQHDSYPESKQKKCYVLHKNLIISQIASSIFHNTIVVGDKDKLHICMFYIKINRFMGAYSDTDKYADEIMNLFKKNNISYNVVDTAPGAFNLNQDHIETEAMRCYVEYTGVYPVYMTPTDVATLVYMEKLGLISITVMVKDSYDGIWRMNG